MNEEAEFWRILGLQALELRFLGFGDLGLFSGGLGCFCWVVWGFLGVFFRVFWGVLRVLGVLGVRV